MSTEPNKSNDYLKVKIYPVPFKNGMGYRIGNMKTVLNKKILPFTSTDQVDHFLYNFFNYVKYEGGPKKNEKTIDDRKAEIKKFFKNYEETVLSFDPLTDKKVEDKDAKKGGKSRKHKGAAQTHYRSRKNRTRKNRT
jgi:hypothetical protein